MRDARKAARSAVPTNERRKGSIIMLATAMLIMILAFAAFSVDVGYIVLTKSQMQNAVDAAALSAAMELDGVEDQEDVIVQATQAAAEIAALHRAGDHPSVSVEGNLGKVEFGRRIFNPGTQDYTYLWGPEAVPYNLVKVTATRNKLMDGSTLVEDNRLPLFFAPVIGSDKAVLQTSAIATFRPRDIMLVLDYSASMNDDSELTAISTFGQQAVVDNIQQMWEDLGSPTYGDLDFEPDWVTIPGQPASGAVPHVNVTWKGTQIYVISTKDLSNVVMEYSDGDRQKIEGLSNPSGTFKGTGGNSNKLIVRCWIKSGSNSSGDGPGYGEKFDFFNKSHVKKGLGLDDVDYPYPSGSWNNYIDYALSDSSVNNAGYRRKFGMLTLIDYWNKNKPLHSQTPDLWKASQQPITALKDSVDVLMDYLTSVSAEDHVGLSVYTYTDNSDSILEAGLGADFSLIKTISRQRQAGHYDQYTNIGAGIRKGRLEMEANARPDSYRMMVLMTDGIANRSLTGASPANFALDEAELTAAAGIKITTISLGAGADTALMQQIADMGGGTHFNVPGGSSVYEYETELKEVFRQIASDRPLKLIMEEQ